MNNDRYKLMDLIDPEAVKQMLGYKDSASFYETVRREGIPHVTINQRRIRFPRPELEAWLAKRYSHGGLN